jgi:ABC-type branched-subunit amino acid transport system ATPase component
MELPQLIPKIKSIEIENEGIIKKAKLEFTEGLNIIVGPNGSGKTTAINAIRKASESHNGNVVLWDGRKLDEFSYGELIALNLVSRCILMDDQLLRLARDKRYQVLKELAGLQIIMALKETPKVVANIIHTEDFKLWEDLSKQRMRKVITDYHKKGRETR